MKTERNYGIDLLRIVSMLMVVILHINSIGGLQLAVKTNGNTMGYAVVYAGEVACYCAVNCFALISGYVGIKFGGGKYKNIISLYIEALFYSVVLALIMWISGKQNMSIESAMKALFPISFGTWWYLTSYVVVALLAPFINAFLHSITQKCHKSLCILLIALFSFFSVTNDCFKIDWGLSSWWLIGLYIIGAYISCYGFDKMLSPIWYICGYICSVFITIGGGVIFRKCLKWNNFLLEYTSFTILLSAICLLLLFEKIKIETPKALLFIRTISPHAFAVYLIHFHWAVRPLIMEKKFVFISQYPFWVIPIVVICSAMAIFAGCIVLDIMRAWIFKKIKIGFFVDYVSEQLYKLIGF